MRSSLAVFLFITLVTASSLATAAERSAASYSAQTSDAELEKALRARGFLGDSAQAQISEPLGVEIDEYVQRIKGTGEEMSRVKEWEEPIGDKLLDVMMVKFPGGQSLTQFFVLPKDGRGCILFGQRGHSRSGRPLMSDEWRYDSDLRIPGADELPSEAFPNMGISAPSFLRALDSPKVGGTGAINQLTSPIYGADAFLDKPFDFEDLERIIDELLAPPAPAG